MTIGTLGTTTTTALWALPAWSAALSPADVAAMAQAITDDAKFASILAGFGAGATGVIGTATMASNTAITNMTRVSGAAIGTIRVGDLALGSLVPPGTFVVAVASGGASLTLSQATLGSGGGKELALVRANPPGLSLADQRLVIPNRGVLKVLPGDIVALDNTGWPILVSGAAIGYAGSQWHLV